MQKKLEPVQRRSRKLPLFLVTACFILFGLINIFSQVSAEFGRLQVNNAAGQPPLWRDIVTLSWKDMVALSPFKRVGPLLEQARDKYGGDLFLGGKTLLGTVRLDDLIGLLNFKPEKCTKTYFRRQANMLDILRDGPLEAFTREAISRWKDLCSEYSGREKRLDNLKLKPETQKYFDLFLKYDKVGKDFYDAPRKSIAKLRQLIQDEIHYDGEKAASANLEGEQKPAREANKRSQEMATGFLNACKDIWDTFAGSGLLNKQLELFAQQLARSRPKSRAFLRNLAFCKHLVNLDYSRELGKVLSAERQFEIDLIEFGKIFVKNLDKADKGSASHGQTAMRAAFELARKRCSPKEFEAASDRLPLLEQSLGRLRSGCRSNLAGAKDFLWLREQTSELLTTQLQELVLQETPSYHALNACKKLEGIDNDKMLAFLRTQLDSSL